MSKFNKRKRRSPSTSVPLEPLEEPKVHETQTTNYEGAVAFENSRKLRLYSMVSTCLVQEPKFYKEVRLKRDGQKEEIKLTATNQDQQILQDIKAMAKEDPIFLMKLAVYTRNKMGLRSIPTAILVEASLMKETKPYVRRAAPLILRRVDEMTNSLAYLQSIVGDLGSKRAKGSIPWQLKAGIADTFRYFTIHFEKYKDERSMFKLADVIRLTHPRPMLKGSNEPDPKVNLMYKRIRGLHKGETPSPDNTMVLPFTWESFIMREGSTKANWEGIAPRAPYMATLRNLRNFIMKDVSNETIDIVCKKLTNKDQVLRSKQFPFRFYNAYRELEHFERKVHDKRIPKVMQAISDALDISTANIPRLRGRTLITADNSDSMVSHQLSFGREKRDKERRERDPDAPEALNCAQIANLFLAMTYQICDTSIASIFGDSFAVKDFRKSERILDNMMSIRQHEVGTSTNAYLAIKYLMENNITVDRIIMFSDEQCYDSNASQSDRSSYYSSASVHQLLERYRKRYNQDCFFYSFDLTGYGLSQVPEDDKRSMKVGGWSENILKYIPVFETDGKTALDDVENTPYDVTKADLSKLHMVDVGPSEPRSLPKTESEEDTEKAEEAEE